MAFADGERLLSCGVDRNIKLWDTRKHVPGESEAGPSEVSFQRARWNYLPNSILDPEAIEHIPGKDSL